MRKYPKQFQKVVEFLKSLDVKVMIDSVTYYREYKGGKSICIHQNYNLEKNGLIALLHEAGHVLQTQSKNQSKSRSDS